MSHWVIRASNCSAALASLLIITGAASYVSAGGSKRSTGAARVSQVKEGQTTEDYKFTLETVACLGACFLAPTMMVNKNYFGKLSPPKISSILKQYER